MARGDNPFTLPDQCTSCCCNFNDAFFVEEAFSRDTERERIHREASIRFAMSKCESFQRSSGEKCVEATLLHNNLGYFL